MFSSLLSELRLLVLVNLPKTSRICVLFLHLHGIGITYIVNRALKGIYFNYWIITLFSPW